MKNLRTALATSLFGGLACLLVAVVAAPVSLSAEDFAAAIEAAHGGDAWNRQAAIEVPIQVQFGGNTMVDGTMMLDTPVGHTRIELKDGTVLVFDGADAWTSPADSAFQGTRFHVLTWPYFLGAPMKLDDPGTHVEPLGKLPFRDGQLLDAARLTFDSGVGDSPDDWYVLYRDSSGRLAGMAYIVTFGKEVAEAEKEPHAIAYDGWTTVDGVTLPTRWSFHNWNQKEGITGDPIGSATLGTPRFVDPADDAFTRPEDARKEPAPGN